ncbi:major facilitator superfamily domain-containing protein 12-like isoform X1 [Haliotis rubra]|uniref:major facilitator superfamily domain-containing protein 12-like isoform X1 n=1 Tax=Haliotis rubra TaxID=36100 RepID=UPI001EE57495|nr:major facilitator superfamily domain-containing protein 12-like isoform X1 [Haliotis rubra]XP_046543116.1 major facilitator superfamily domain-containing protein 12-like isoform X1 [Haliotis rubra]XP_046543117.1 major facilitator superfamily domain-containing protein 12-like isoform X1 [Haliotis rubra]
MADIEAPKMSFVSRLSYGVGHVLNDLTASMWFSYLLIYLHQVKNFNNKLAGDLMLIGQVSDALATPFIGYESDRTKGICKMGKRKSWHLVGTLCVACSFPFLFIGCITCNHAPDWAQFVYFVPFVVIFQFGWASTQISHLSLIPDLTPNESERVGLNGLRYAFTVLSNLAVFGIAWLLLALGSNSDTTQLSDKDAPKFRDLAFIVIGTGLVFSFLFHIGTKEKRTENLDPEFSHGRDALDTTTSGSLQRSSKCNRMSTTDWLKEPQFFQVGVLYMCTRLYVNLSQVYLPMYLVETLSLDKTNIAIVPLVVYVTGFFTSLVMKPVNHLVGRKVTYIIGIVFAVGSCVWIHFITSASAMQVFGVAVLMGVGGTTMLITSLAMTADLIGNNTESGAFVYGAMSFTDKLSNGIAIEIIQLLHPCVFHAPCMLTVDCCPLCLPFYRLVQSVVPGSCAILGFVVLLTLLPQKLGARWRDKVELTVDPLFQNGSLPAVCDDDCDEKSPLLKKNINTSPVVRERLSSNSPQITAILHTSMNSPPVDVEAIK